MPRKCSLAPASGQVYVTALPRMLAGSLADIVWVPRQRRTARVHTQDSYSPALRAAGASARCTGDAVAGGRVLEIELNAVTDNPLVFLEAADAPLEGR